MDLRIILACSIVSASFLNPRLRDGPLIPRALYWCEDLILQAIRRTYVPLLSTH